MEQHFRFIYKNHKPFVIKLAGYMMIGVALVRIMDTPLFSIVMGILSGGIFMYQRGVDIDIAARKYRYFTSFGPQEFGTWEALDPVEYVSVFTANYSASVSGMTTTKLTMNQELIEVNLVKSKRDLINVYLTKDKEEAFQIAGNLATQLSLRIYDATTRDKKWVTPENNTGSAS